MGEGDFLLEEDRVTMVSAVLSQLGDNFVRESCSYLLHHLNIGQKRRPSQIHIAHEASNGAWLTLSRSWDLPSETEL